MAEYCAEDPDISVCLDDNKEDTNDEDSAADLDLDAVVLNINSNLVHSPTSDTLESVALEPPEAELPVSEGVLEGGILLEDIQGISLVADELDSVNNEAVLGSNIPSSSKNHSGLEDVDDVKAGRTPSITSYFMSDTQQGDISLEGSFFDTLSDNTTDVGATTKAADAGYINETANSFFNSLPSSSDTSSFFDNLSDAKRALTLDDVDECGSLNEINSSGALSNGPQFDTSSINSSEQQSLNSDSAPVHTDMTEPLGDGALSLSDYQSHVKERISASSTDAEVVHFDGETETSSDFNVTEALNPEEQSELNEENFEPFTAEGDENSVINALENLSISPNLTSFIPPARDTRHVSGDGMDATGHLPLRSLSSSQPETSFSSVISPAHKLHGIDARVRSLSQSSQSASPIPGSPAHAPHSVLVTEPTFQPFHDDSVSREDDPFTASLQMSDSDRRYDAWIPSDSTRQVLVSMVMSPSQTYFPTLEQLSMPGVIVDEAQGDPVHDLVIRDLGEQEAAKRQVLTADSVPQTTDGLAKLIECDCLRAAVDLTGRLLTDAGQGLEKLGKPSKHSSETLQLWFCRFCLLTRLRLHSIVELEFQAFQTLDTADLYYEYYTQTYPGKRGTLVPFGMRLLHAESPHHLGRSPEALDRLYYILAIVQKILSNLQNALAEDGSMLELSPESRKVSIELWQEREQNTLYIIGNTLLAIKDYEASLRVYESLVEKDTSHHMEVQNGIAKIYLQMGNVDKAEECFNKVNSQLSTDSKTACFQISMNKGHVSLCKNNFSDAAIHFKAALQIEPSNAVALNNLAVCLLYMGQLHEALTLLEGLVQRDPQMNLQEGLMYNLCTMYQLKSAWGTNKKQALLSLVNKFKGDAFPIASLNSVPSAMTTRKQGR